MQKICIHCGNMIDLDKGDCCSICGARYDANYAMLPYSVTVGTKTQLVVVVAYILAIFSLTVGLGLTMLAMFSEQLAKIITRGVCIEFLGVVPLCYLLLSFLELVAIRTYKPNKHSIVNQQRLQKIYKLKLVAWLGWLCLIVCGEVVAILSYK